jgi:hypothetical protein
MNTRKLIAIALVLSAGSASADPSYFSLTLKEYKGYKSEQICSKGMFDDLELAALRDEVNLSGTQRVQMKALHIETINNLAESCEKLSKRFGVPLR